MNDEIDAPLGDKKKQELNKIRQDKTARKGWRSLVQFNSNKLPLARILIGLLFALIAFIAAIFVFVDNPDGGRPNALVPIVDAPIANQVATKISNENKKPEINIVNEEVTQLENSGTSISIIKVDENMPDAGSISTIGIEALNEFGAYANLVEKTPNGAIPQVGKDGKTPFNAYQRASISPAAASGKTLIAIVVTGLGLSESGTIDAIDKLPDNVTLAFAPYGRTLNRTTAAAREGGHEILLSLPLEPFDYPQNDPGPQTLLVDQPTRANLDRLFWLMGRFGGYVGVINHMGAKFTSSAADFNPIMEELALRGLGYIDDGSSKRSLAANLANNNRVPFAYGAVILDNNPSRSAILASLRILEKTATEKNGALGIASALPISIKTISE